MSLLVTMISNMDSVSYKLLSEVFIVANYDLKLRGEKGRKTFGRLIYM